MSKIDLSRFGITDVSEIVYNPSYELLFEEEMKSGLTGFEKGQLTELDTVNVMTGTLSWTRTQRTPFGGQQTHTRMTTIP